MRHRACPWRTSFYFFFGCLVVPRLPFPPPLPSLRRVPPHAPLLPRPAFPRFVAMLASFVLFISLPPLLQHPSHQSVYHKRRPCYRPQDNERQAYCQGQCDTHPFLPSRSVLPLATYHFFSALSFWIWSFLFALALCASNSNNPPNIGHVSIPHNRINGEQTIQNSPVATHSYHGVLYCSSIIGPVTFGRVRPMSLAARSSSVIGSLAISQIPS